MAFFCYNYSTHLYTDKQLCLASITLVRILAIDSLVGVSHNFGVLLG